MTVIELKPLPVNRRFFCVYSGAEFPDRLLSAEHTIPLSLGGTRVAVIRCLETLNSRLGSEIDAKIANDAIIQFGRRDAKAKGNSGKVPLPTLKGAAAWRWDQRLDTLEPRYTLQIPANGELMRKYDTRTENFLLLGLVLTKDIS